MHSPHSGEDPSMESTSEEKKPLEVKEVLEQSQKLQEKLMHAEHLNTIVLKHRLFFKNALHLFKKYDIHNELRETAFKIEEYNPLHRFFQKDILGERDYEKLMHIALQVYWDEDYTSAKEMFHLISHVFPLNAQPHILLAEIEGKQQGADAAVASYEKLVKILKNPLLFLYAAQCFRKANKIEKAKDLLFQAMWLCSEEPQAFAPLVHEIEDEIKQIDD